MKNKKVDIEETGKRLHLYLKPFIHELYTEKRMVELLQKVISYEE